MARSGASTTLRRPRGSGDTRQAMGFPAHSVSPSRAGGAARGRARRRRVPRLPRRARGPAPDPDRGHDAADDRPRDRQRRRARRRSAGVARARRDRAQRRRLGGARRRAVAQRLVRQRRARAAPPAAGRRRHAARRRRRRSCFAARRRRSPTARSPPAARRRPGSPRPSGGCSSRCAGRCSAPGLVATPASNREIADELVLSLSASRSHIRALFVKLDVDELPQNRKRAELARRALESGLVTTRDVDP